SVVLHINATVDAGVANSSSPIVALTNVANVTGTDDTGKNATASTNANVIIYYANVSLVKLDITPLPPSPGGTVIWRLNVSNPGQVTLDPVALTDVLPAGISFVSASTPPDSVSPDNRTVSWNNIGPLSPGSSVVIVLNSSVDNNTANGTYTNNANTTGTPP